MYMSQDVHKYNHEKDAPRTVGVTENCISAHVFTCTVFFLFKFCTLSCLDLFLYFSEHKEVIFHTAVYAQTILPCLQKKSSFKQ